MYKRYDQLDYSKSDKDVSIHHLKDEEDKKRQLNNNTVCVIDVYADWCGPCKMISPKIDELHKKYHKPGLFSIVKEDAALDITHGVRGLPTFLFYCMGKLQEEFTVVGADVSAVEKNINACLKKLQFGTSKPLD